MTDKSKENMIFSGNAKVDGAYHTAEWLFTAFASTLVFIVFIMQVYRIPTGSMAETLRGAHFRLRCEQCGYAYDHDFRHEQYKLPNTVTPSKPMPIVPLSPRCPSCGFAQANPQASSGKYFFKKDGQFVEAPTQTVFKGDQIFVQKCIYQFSCPKRWDVIVFKNPTEPRINYIKRCIGLPGETIQIIDGDIYVDGSIQRKPENVQEELWMVIYDNDYQPVNPSLNQFNGHTWQQPFEKVGTSKWNLSADGPTVFALDLSSDEVQRIQYNDKQGNNFQATYAFDDPGLIPYMPICSDLMVSFYADIQQQSAVGAHIRKYGVTYEGWIKSDGAMTISRLTPAGQSVIVAEGQCHQADLGKTGRFRLATVDHLVTLEFGSSRLLHDLGTGMDDAGTDRQNFPEVQILGKGQVRLTHIALHRDIHYLSPHIAAFPTQSGSIVYKEIPVNARQDAPMLLKKDEYFACGDNSPASADSRLWYKHGLGNNGHRYPMGVVPKEYMVGKAMVVHWPGGYRLKNEPIRWIPFADGFKVIYGGKDEKIEQ
ncbi:MAG: signal peptidase I [Planctomycetota bacterium]